MSGPYMARFALFVAVSKPENAARAYLLVIAREPKAVDRALRGAA